MIFFTQHDWSLSQRWLLWQRQALGDENDFTRRRTCKRQRRSLPWNATQDSCRGGVSGTTVGPAFDSGGSITFASAMMASECLRRCSGVGDGADNGYWWSQSWWRRRLCWKRFRRWYSVEGVFLVCCCCRIFFGWDSAKASCGQMKNDALRTGSHEIRSVHTYYVHTI